MSSFKSNLLEVYQEPKQRGNGPVVVKAKEGYKVKEEWRTEFYDIEFWGKTGEFAQKIQQGDLIIAEGEIRTNVWEDKDGNKRYSQFITGYTFVNASDRVRKKDARAQGNPSRAQAGAVSPTKPQADVALPF